MKFWRTLFGQLTHDRLPPMPLNGEMTVPTGPGLGLKFAPDLSDKYGVG